MITVGQPNTILPPWAHVSPILAAGLFPIKTVAEPFTIESGGPTQTAESPMTAAGRKEISTVGAPGPMTGPPTWGTGPVVIGQTCKSVILAANGISSFFNLSLLPLLLQRFDLRQPVLPELFLLWKLLFAPLLPDLILLRIHHHLNKKRPLRWYR